MTIATQITSLTIVYSAVYSDADQEKHQNSASLAFVRGIHQGPVNSPHKWPVTRKMFSFDDVIMATGLCPSSVSLRLRHFIHTKWQLKRPQVTYWLVSPIEYECIRQKKRHCKECLNVILSDLAIPSYVFNDGLPPFDVGDSRQDLVFPRVQFGSLQVIKPKCC